MELTHLPNDAFTELSKYISGYDIINLLLACNTQLYQKLLESLQQFELVIDLNRTLNPQWTNTWKKFHHMTQLRIGYEMDTHCWSLDKVDWGNTQKSLTDLKLRFRQDFTSFSSFLLNQLNPIEAFPNLVALICHGTTNLTASISSILPKSLTVLHLNGTPGAHPEAIGQLHESIVDLKLNIYSVENHSFPIKLPPWLQRLELISCQELELSEPYPMSLVKLTLEFDEYVPKSILRSNILLNLPTYLKDFEFSYKNDSIQLFLPLLDKLPPLTRFILLMENQFEFDVIAKLPSSLTEFSIPVAPQAPDSQLIHPAFWKLPLVRVPTLVTRSDQLFFLTAGYHPMVTIDHTNLRNVHPTLKTLSIESTIHPQHVKYFPSNLTSLNLQSLDNNVAMLLPSTLTHLELEKVFLDATATRLLPSSLRSLSLSLDWCEHNSQYALLPKNLTSLSIQRPFKRSLEFLSTDLDRFPDETFSDVPFTNLRHLHFNCILNQGILDAIISYLDLPVSNLLESLSMGGDFFFRSTMSYPGVKFPCNLRYLAIGGFECSADMLRILPRGLKALSWHSHATFKMSELLLLPRTLTELKSSQSVPAISGNRGCLSYHPHI